jgi:hypothetical protein
MRTRLLKTSLAAALLAGLTLASSAGLAQGGKQYMTPEDVENQLKSQWKDDADHCDKAQRTQIAGADIIGADQYRKWLEARKAGKDARGSSGNVVPNARYVQVTSLADKKPIAVYGPVASTAIANEFRNLVGMHFCDHSPGK